MTFTFGPFEVDEHLFELRRDGVPLPVQRKTLDLLLYLIRTRGNVVTREELTREVWAGVVVSEAALTQAILTVRKALSDDGADPKIIKTARGRGYRFVMEVSETTVRTSKTGTPPPKHQAANALGATPFVGRVSALARLDSAASEAREGRGRIVLVVGPQGIGKTRLLEEFAQRTTGFRTVKAYGFHGEGAPPLWPWLQIERRIEDRPDGEDGEALASPAARFRYADRLTRRLLDVAREQPLLLVIEDLHWADAPSLEMLMLMVPELARARIMLALTTRGPTASGAENAAGTLARHAITSTIELEPLDRGEIEALVHAMTGRVPSPAVVERVLEKTGGTPSLFVQIAHILEPAGVHVAGTSAMLRTSVVKEAVAHQVASLSPSGREALTLAAVMGASFELGPFALALEATTDATLRLLDEAIAARVVSKGEQEGSYRFTQPLVRDALFRKLPEGERARLHGRVGKALIAFFGPEEAERHAEMIAPHLVEMSVLGDVEAGVRFALLAHAQAVTRDDAAAAARYLDLARRALKNGRASPESEALGDAIRAASAPK